jgi:hypothetical protein
MLSTRAAWWLSIVLLVVPCARHAARACKCAGDVEAFLVRNGSHLPGNALGVAWWPGPSTEDYSPNPRAFRVRRMSPGKPENVPLRIRRLEEGAFLIAPTEIRRGSTYRFEYHELRDPTWRPDYEELHFSVDVTFDREVWKPDGASLRLELGERRRDDLTVMTARGSCSETIDAGQLPIRVEVPSDLTRWIDGLFISTEVDRHSWRPSDSLCSPVPPGRSWRTRGSELLFVNCGTDRSGPPGLAAGSHTVRMEIKLPGTDQAITAEQAKVVLECDSDHGSGSAPDAPEKRAGERERRVLGARPTALAFSYERWRPAAIFAPLGARAKALAGVKALARYLFN